MKKYSIKIQGMDCASCAGNIERSLKSVKGVRDAKVMLMLNKGKVEAEDSVYIDEIKKAVSKAGYKAISVEED